MYQIFINLAITLYHLHEVKSQGGKFVATITINNCMNQSTKIDLLVRGFKYHLSKLIKKCPGFQRLIFSADNCFKRNFKTIFFRMIKTK